MLKIIKTILGTRAHLKRSNNARSAIVAIYQFSKILTSNMKLKPR